MNARVEQALRSLNTGRREDVERALDTLQGIVYGFGMKVCGVREDAEDDVGCARREYRHFRAGKKRGNPRWQAGVPRLLVFGVNPQSRRYTSLEV
jgi:hypothetical protein